MILPRILQIFDFSMMTEAALAVLYPNIEDNAVPQHSLALQFFFVGLVIVAGPLKFLS